MSKKGKGKTKKPETLCFNCSFCGASWEASKSEFVMTEIKGNNKLWARFSMPCPECHRTVSEIKEL